MANKIGALWLKETKGGKKILSGEIKIEGKKTRITVFKNDYKKEPKQPDYNIMEDTYEPKPAAVNQQESEDLPF